ncbi:MULTISPECIES: MarR family winged helix-turn-helix transcriptional regulator [unclassified Cupriavidus]|uniref:MarR family winged helix-turn-helix transcriptional regulator n=1 Tax=unclassified Cupriavidus TaxID=2640874 RepID=UPI0010F4996C|nr:MULTISPECIES: MarR family transcriptional regulator [unclassified Cupriavidus]MWL91116.1 MarR family transcriptional regulator [Cupriavidus sp. SW-Y-13]
MSSTPHIAPIDVEPVDPWSSLDEAGNGLTVNDFLTTMLSQLVTALRNSVTEPYATQFDLTVPEWRILALLAADGEAMSFAELVKQSTSDKALVSRTLRLLEDRGLVILESEGSTPRKRLACKISEQGAALHAQVIPLARRGQASVIRLLSPEERQGLYTGLRKLHGICTGSGKE